MSEEPDPPVPPDEPPTAEAPPLEPAARPPAADDAPQAGLSTGDKYAALVEEIFHRTVQRDLEWGTHIQGVYAAALGKYEVRISIERAAGQDDSFRIRIYDKLKGEVDEIADQALEDAAPRIEGFETYRSLMSELHRRAGREASGAEKALDEILKDLGIAAEPRRKR